MTQFSQEPYSYPPQGRPPQPASSTRLPLLLAILLGLVVGWVVYRLMDNRMAASNAVPRVVTPRGDLAADERANIELFENASPSVVFITTVALRRDLLGLNVTKIAQGTGSGFIWDQQGHIVTNFHVVEGAGNNSVQFEVTLSDHSTWKATVVGAAPDHDLAVLRIAAPAARLRPITIGASRDLQVGQKVYAIGNPFGLDQTLTTGIVSALGRTIPTANDRTIKDVIQTDAAINPGNSGGPLLDSAGRMIGVNTAIFSPSGASVGIGFAVPVDDVNRVVPQLISKGRFARPRLGITTAHDRVVRNMNLRGVLIVEVEPGSGAEAAGLKGISHGEDGGLIIGDVITAIDAKPVKNTDDLLSVLERKKVGDTIAVTVQRNDKTHTVDVTLQ